MLYAIAAKVGVVKLNQTSVFTGMLIEDYVLIIFMSLYAQIHELLPDSDVTLATHTDISINRNEILVW